MNNKVNYLAEMYGLDKIEAKDISIDEKNNYTINGEKYKDPDSESKSLYKKWQEFLINKIPEGKFEFNKCSEGIKATINEKIFLLSPDYIGPSKYFAAKAFRTNKKDVNKEMANIFNICRHSEGHIIWPKGQIIASGYIPYGPIGRNSINMSRGGKTAGVCDRFDITLYLLKKYYNLFIEEKVYLNTKIFNRAKIFINSCSDAIAIKDNRHKLFNLFLSFELTSEWLGVFNTFNTFIQTFALQDFINNDGKPFIWKKEDKIINEFYEPKEYIEYIYQCKSAIEKRGEHLL